MSWLLVALSDYKANKKQFANESGAWRLWCI